MSETLIYVILFALIIFFMHRGHGGHRGMGGCGGHSQHGHGQKKPDATGEERQQDESEHVHHH